MSYFTFTFPFPTIDSVVKYFQTFKLTSSQAVASTYKGRKVYYNNRWNVRDRASVLGSYEEMLSKNALRLLQTFGKLTTDQ